MFYQFDLPTRHDNPLYGSGDAPVEAVTGVSGILAYLEEQAENMAAIQGGSARPVIYSSRAVGGQCTLLGLLRRTLDQAADRMDACG